MDTQIDFQKGGEYGGMYYPKLKPIGAAIVYASGGERSYYYHYEPGNMTRYETLFTDVTTKYEGNMLVMTLICPRNTSMIIPNNGHMDMYDIGYIMEKTGLREGDAYALLQLINHHLGVRKVFIKQ